MPDPGLQREFLNALARADTSRIRELVAAGADVNLPIGNPGGETPLIRAITNGDLSVVRLLLQTGADANLPWKGPRSWTPLMFAHDDPAMLRELVAAGADVNARSTAHSMTAPAGDIKLIPGRETALHLAAAAGNAEAIRVLIRAGAEVETQAEDGQAPLDCAVRQGSVTEAAAALVEAGAQLTPQRLEVMHAAAHNPESDLIAFPLPTAAGRSQPGDDETRRPNEAEKFGQNTEQPVTSGTRPKELRCPKCHALIYSRKPRICGQCGALLAAGLFLTDQQAEALDAERQWARQLADKFSSRANSQRQLVSPSAAQSPAAEGQAGTVSAQELLNRVSCAEEFKHRDRPAFWLYLVGYSLTMLTVVFLAINLGGVPPTAMLIMLGFLSLLCLRAWHCASPVCPNCKQNIRYCSATFCHVCGQPLSHGRCERCGVDNSWTSFFRPYSSGSFRWITHCPGCGVLLDSKVSRWRSGR